MVRPTRPAEDRFRDLIHPEDRLCSDGRCWRWTGALSCYQYPSFYFGPDKPQVAAKRAAWYFHYGVWPAGKLDHTPGREGNTKLCVNPHHYTHKYKPVTLQVLRTVSKLHASGVSYNQLAKTYGVSSTTLRRALRETMDNYVVLEVEAHTQLTPQQLKTQVEGWLRQLDFTYEPAEENFNVEIVQHS